MMQFRPASFDEVKRAWAIMQGADPLGVIPSPMAWYDKNVNDLKDIRAAEEGGLNALKCLVHTDGEGQTLKDYRRRLIQNVPHVRKIVKERVGQTYSDPPDVKIRVADQEPESDFVIGLNEYIRLILEQNGGNNLFVKHLIRKAVRDKASTAKVFPSPVSKKVMIAPLEIEKVVYIPDPEVDKIFLAALEIRSAGNGNRYRLWTTLERFEIDKDWAPVGMAEENEVEGVVPYIQFGDLDECTDMDDAVMDQSAFINLRNTQHVGIKYQAFATKVIAGQVMTPKAKTRDGKEAVAGGVDHYISIEKDGEAFMLRADFNVEGITKSVDQWRKTSLQDADISAASIDQSMAAEQPMTMAMREMRPLRAASEQMAVYIPQHEQLIRTILAYALAFDEDFKASYGTLDLKQVSISITRSSKAIPIDRLIKRQADREDVKSGLMAPEMYIAEHVMPGADKDAIQKQADEYESTREAEANRMSDLFPPARSGRTSNVTDGSTGSGGTDNGNGKGKKPTPAERALDRVGPRN